MEQWKDAEETQIDKTEQDYIYLSLQDGESFLILSQEPKAEISDAPAISDEHFYGVFWIHENDYMVYTAMPMTSFQEYYKMPKIVFASAHPKTQKYPEKSSGKKMKSLGIFNAAFIEPREIHASRTVATVQSSEHSFVFCHVNGRAYNTFYKDVRIS